MFKRNHFCSHEQFSRKSFFNYFWVNKIIACQWLIRLSCHLQPTVVKNFNLTFFLSFFSFFFSFSLTCSYQYMARWRTDRAPRLPLSWAFPAWKWRPSRTPEPPWRSSRGRRAAWQGPAWWISIRQCHWQLFQKSLSILANQNKCPGNNFFTLVTCSL